MVRNVVWLLSCLLLCLGGCSLEDERDLCCERNLMHFRYLYRGKDRFQDKIFRMRYYLFDVNGDFLKQMDAFYGDKTKVSLTGLPEGDYTMVALANLDDYNPVDSSALEGLWNFEFVMRDFFPGTNELESGDPLYWGIKSFQIRNNESNVFLTEMANIHCILYIRFEWEGLPPYPDGYSFQLEGVSEAYYLNMTNNTHIGVQSFPEHQEKTNKVRRSVTLEELKLEMPVYTLRYMDDRIPQMRVWHDDEPITKPIDLEVAFQQWGWFPDRNPAQEYGLDVILKLNGSIEVKPRTDADVNDWQNGGVIG